MRANTIPDQLVPSEREKAWKNFEEATHPTSIMALLPKQSIEHLLGGLFLDTHRGVSLLYGVRGTDGLLHFAIDQRIDPFNIHTGKNDEYLNPICRQLRTNESNRGQCEQCDCRHATLHAAQNSIGPQSYRCWLGMHDALSLIRLGGESLAAVFIGQILPDTQEELNDLKAKLESPDVEDGAGILQEVEKQSTVHAAQKLTAKDELDAAEQQLQRFVQGLDPVLQELQKARQTASINNMIGHWERETPPVDHYEESAWWLQVGNWGEDFLRQFKFSKLAIYRRYGRVYERVYPGENAEKVPTPVRLHARDVLHLVPAEALIDLSAQEKQGVLTQLGPGYEKTFLYRTRTAATDLQPGLLFAMDGAQAKDYEQVLQPFFTRTSSRIEHAALSFQIRRTHEEYVKTVAEAAHDFRHPLQIFQFLLDDLFEVPALVEDPDWREELKRAQLRIRQAHVQTLSLLNRDEDKREVFNLVELLDEVIEFLMPKANAHPCPLEKTTDWPLDVLIRANRGQLFRMFLNLIDNAIKYSFMGPRYDVRIRLTPAIGDRPIRVEVRNFGVGIPEEKVAAIREWGQRAEVKDPRVKREGTGVGLSIAQDILKQHGGTLDISSLPAPGDSQRDQSQSGNIRSTEALRYATTVTANLKAYSS